MVAAEILFCAHIKVVVLAVVQYGIDGAGIDKPYGSGR